MAVVLGGIIASLVMGMWEMLVEAFIGQGFFAPVVFIAATVLRDLQSVQGAPGLGPVAPIAIVVGLMGHMMNSIVLGIVFALVARRLVHGPAALAIAGAAFGAIVFAGMWYVVLPLIDPVMLNLNAIAFFLGHMMWGGALGLGLGWRERTAAHPQPRFAEAQAQHSH